MDGEIQAVGSRFTHEDYLMPCLLGYGDAVEIHWQCSKSSEAAAFVLITFKTNLNFNFKTNLKCCLVSVLGGGGEWLKGDYSNVLVGRKRSPVCKNLTSVDLEVCLTETILQTSRLQNLYIWTEDIISAAVMISWLLHAPSSLRILRYGSPTVRYVSWPHRLHVSVLERC
ncbi:unnamed protein product [Sphagnum troendelagicum]